MEGAFVKSPKFFWVYIFIFIVFYLAYQLFFTWDISEQNDDNINIIPEDRVIFLTIEEEKYGLKKASFDSLMESLQVWEFNKKTDTIYMKFDSMLPKSNTQVMIVYDRGFDAFEKHFEVLNISSVPYHYHFKSKPFLTLHHITEDGVAYLEFNGKKLKIEPGEVRLDWSIAGFQPTKYIVTNHGFYNKDRFHKMYMTVYDRESKMKKERFFDETMVSLLSRKDRPDSNLIISEQERPVYEVTYRQNTSLIYDIEGVLLVHYNDFYQDYYYVLNKNEEKKLTEFLNK